MTEQLASSTQTPDSEPANSLVEVHITYVHRLVDPEKEVSAIIDRYKDFSGDVTLFNPASFVAEVVGLPDGGYQLMVSSSSGEIQ